ncbi:hypothetical protein MML63_12475 [Kosakonia sacchari]|uniref:hypothetical protein n=1 Tax=Kosakonia sacchari TaxID=1158459 RepID=UPI0025B0024E|nr:hypothetical protein [Kosakonia sacchari]MDN2486440.1 hypothetical protein [Kosakonia sacchari]
MNKLITYVIWLAGALCTLSLLAMAAGFYEFTVNRLIVDLCGLFVFVTSEIDRRKKA